MLFVNGLPLGIIELKNPADEDATIWTAWQQIQTYKAELPTLFSMNEALVVSDGTGARIGTLTAGREWFKPWRTVTGETLADPHMTVLQVMLEGVFEPGRFLALVHDYIVFEDDDSGALVKKMAGYHQFHAVRVAVMKADAVAPDRREAWVTDRVKQGVDLLICHPRLVQTGLDLVDFPTICWAETDYSVYTMRQASRRSWRIGQTRPVKVVFMSYRTTLQADALKLVGRKLQSSLAVEGELPEDGLAAYGDDGDDIMMALARKIVSGEEQDDAEGQQSLFSWAEFMAEEPVKPKGRSRKAQPASTSPFNWALDMEKEREEELIGLSA